MDNQFNEPANTETVETSVQADTSETVNPEVGTQTETQASWFDNLAPEYKNHASIQKYKSGDDLAKGFINLQGMLGKEKAVIPTDMNDKQAVADYFKKVGMPDDVNGYEFEVNQDELGRDLQLDGFKEIALENNLTKAQAQGLINWYSNNLKSSMTQESEAREAAINTASKELRQEYGAAYDENVSRAKSFFKENFASIADNSELVESLGNNPQFIKDLVGITKKFSEANIGEVQKPTTLTPSEAGQEKVKLMQSEAYRNQLHPEHNATVEKYRSLLAMELANG